MDPICIHDEQTQRLKIMAQHVLSTIDERLTLHDFRIVAEGVPCGLKARIEDKQSHQYAAPAV